MDESKDRDGREPRGSREEAAPTEQTTEDPPVPATRRFPSSNIGRPRIEGVEAGVAAGLVPSTGAPAGGRKVPGAAPKHLSTDELDLGSSLDEIPEDIIEGVELPDWSDPPTREIPRILLRPGEPAGPVIPGPVWRESEQDFEQDREAFAEIVTGSVPVVEHGTGPRDDDLAFDGEPYGPPLPAPGAGADETTVLPVGAARATGEQSPPGPHEGGATARVPAGEGVSFAGRAVRSHGPSSPGSGRRERPKLRRQGSARPGRNPVIAIVTGVVVGGIALLCFWSGPVASLVLSSVVLLLAAAECFKALQRAHYQPATLLGLIAAPGLAIAAYLKGPVAVPIAGAVAVVAVLCWYLVGVTKQAIVANLSVTLFAIGWIAFLGSFAGLLLDPSVFGSHHGVAYLLGAAEVAVAYDIGGYAIGSWLGRHKLAPTISPNKTWEGLIGGSLAALVIALAVTSQMHPWTLERAAALGVVAAILAPIGDLVESLIKRDLNVKDMGSLLPAHGGVLDRVDAILFVLPATYIIVRLFHG